MDITLFIVFLSTCAVAASTGSLFPTGDWYKTLNKPNWTPPNWVFPVAWTILYVLLAVSAARVAPHPQSALAMAFWALQITLNTLWTPVFFGLHRKKAALVVISCLWAAAVGTMVAMWKLDQLAGVLMVPYIVWLTYATALNAYIVKHNPD